MHTRQHHSISPLSIPWHIRLHHVCTIVLRFKFNSFIDDHFHVVQSDDATSTYQDHSLATLIHADVHEQSSTIGNAKNNNEKTTRKYRRKHPIHTVDEQTLNEFYFS
jgi:hypothetical protein